jgi:hypothetical protein
LIKFGQPEVFGATSADYTRAVISETLKMTWAEFETWLETKTGENHA